MLVGCIHDPSARKNMSQIKRHCFVRRLNGCNVTIDPEACLKYHCITWSKRSSKCAYDTPIRIHVDFDVAEPRGLGDLEEVSRGRSERDFREDLCPLGKKRTQVW